MAYLLARLNLQRGYYVTLFAVNYALSGWFVANDLNLLWLDAAILLPLVILQLERLFVQATWWRYALLLGATIICNYYIGYMIAIFLVLYFFWRLTWPQQVQPRWQIFKRFVYGSLTAGALSAWLLLPTIYQLRIGKSQYNSPLTWRFDNNPLQLVFKLIPGSFDFDQMQTGLANFLCVSIRVDYFYYFFNHQFMALARESRRFYHHRFLNRGHNLGAVDVTLSRVPVPCLVSLPV